MKLEKIKKVKGNVVSYDYYKVEEDGLKTKISNMEYIEKSVLENNTEKVKDNDFNSSNSTVGQFYVPKKSSRVIKAEKKLTNKIKKTVKKPNRIHKLIDLIQKNCESITLLEDILKSSYDESVIQLQLDLEDSKRAKDKLVKKLSKLLYGKNVKTIDEMKSEHQYDTIQRKKIQFQSKFDKNEKLNPLYPFNTDLSIEQKRDILFNEIGIII